jgi:succinylglutamate desuccinylase
LLETLDFGVEVVAAYLDVKPEEATRGLAELANAQLLQVAGSSGQRYRFHDLVRLFAREQAEKEEDAEARSAALRRALD